MGADPFSFGVNGKRFVVAPRGRNSWFVHGGVSHTEATLTFEPGGYKLVVKSPWARTDTGVSWQALLSQL